MPRPKNRVLRSKILALYGEGYVTPKAIYQKLREEGFPVKYSYVRTIMSRMRQEGLLDKAPLRRMLVVYVQEAIDALEDAFSRIYSYDRVTAIKYARAAEKLKQVHLALMGGKLV